MSPRFDAGVADIPLALYVHLPWCIKKCPYCDFNSHERTRETLPDEAYVDALLADLESQLPLVWGRKIVSVFFGGGTPNLFSTQAIARLMAGLRARLPIKPGTEITMEANPGAFETQQFEALAEAGITRLSLGVQSFSGDALKALGRVHNANEALQAAAAAKECFERLNFDLMYGLPGQGEPQSLAQAMQDLDTALDLDPGHLSLYQLTLEPNTLFATRPPRLPDEDLCIDMQEALLARLAERGYERVEISAFARPGHECEHNINYWQFGDYIGIGAGAHGKISLPGQGIQRTHAIRRPEDYMAALAQGRPPRQERWVAEADRPFEFMLNALRLVQGFTAEQYRQRTGLGLEGVLPTLGRLQARGLIQASHGGFRATPLGLDHLNAVQAEFLSDAA